ncbi:MAG: AbrB/MazE/SpoVT family DNA-binding domain-containing protein [Candidatus Saccharimonadales bacterium]
MKTFSTTITSKGQVTVPVTIRRKLGISTSDRLRVKEVKGQIILEKDDYWVEFERLQKKVQKHRKERGIAPLLVEEIEQLRDQAWKDRA